MHCKLSTLKLLNLNFVQARYQKERAANRRNEILLDQLCTEIEVKAVAVQNQQVQYASGLCVHLLKLFENTFWDSLHHVLRHRGIANLYYTQTLCHTLKRYKPDVWVTGGVRAGEGGVREHDAVAGGVGRREAVAGGAAGAGRH